MTKTEKQKKQRAWRPVHISAAAALALALTAVLALAFRPRHMGSAPPPAKAPTQPPTEAETLPPPPANPYGPGDFQYDGDYLTCLAGDSVLGIDVSSHQGEVDWQAVREAGVEFVMLRVGYRGYKTGDLTADTMAQENYRAAREAGLQIGAYFYSQALTPAEASEEAEFVLAQIGDWILDMPLVYDWEYVSAEARTGAMDADTLTECTLAFCRAVEQAGYTPMIYFNRHQAQELLHLELLTDYDFWLALYADEMTYPYRIAMWQYTNYGTVPGIGTDVDINLYLPASTVPVSQ